MIANLLIMIKQGSANVLTGVAILLFAACTTVQTQTTEAPGAASDSVSPAPSASRTESFKPGVKKYGYNSIETDEKVVAMTFDDGPHPKLTPKLLDILKERGIRATFYVIGRNAAEYPEIMKRMIDEGHEVGNHTWTHPYLTRLSTSSVQSEMSKTADIIVKTTGKKAVTMRPPYGAINTRLRHLFTDDMELPVIMWSVDPRDWQRPGSSVVTSRIVEGAHPGAIILAHDIHPGTITAMPAAFDQLTRKGYKFVTVSELLEMEGDDAPEPVEATEAPEVIAPTVTTASTEKAEKELEIREPVVITTQEEAPTRPSGARHAALTE